MPQDAMRCFFYLSTSPATATLAKEIERLGFLVVLVGVVRPFLRSYVHVTPFGTIGAAAKSY
jgi:hypothetical protein